LPKKAEIPGFFLSRFKKTRRYFTHFNQLASLAQIALFADFFSTRRKGRSFRRGARRGVPKKRRVLSKRRKKEKKSGETFPFRRRDLQASAKARKLFAVPIAKFSACNKIGLMDFGAERVDAFFRPLPPRRSSFVDR
jgi:hypothetical protein